MIWQDVFARLLLLGTLVATSQTLRSYENKVHTMRLVDGRWSDDRASRVSRQDLVNAILNDVTKPVYFPKGNKNIVFGVDPRLHYEGLQFCELYMKNDVDANIERLIEKSSIVVHKVELLSDRLVRIEDEQALMKLSRRQSFSIVRREHDHIASTLIRVLLEFDTAEKLISAAVYLRDRVNVELFVYSFSVAVLNHPEFTHVKLPPLIHTMPRKFIDEMTFNDLYQQVINQIEAQVMDPIHVQFPVQYTASDKEPEQKLAYFREDIEVNMHHWHWHTVYSGSGPEENVKAKDRRGELFYFMHQQMMARYDFARLSNRMPRVLRLNMGDPILDGYFPKLPGPAGGGSWGGRPTGVTLEGVESIRRWENRILSSIQQRHVIAENGSLISLNNLRGIDILGNILLCSVLSPNPDLYGSLHNEGHKVISQAHDPDGRFMEPPGVMADTATAVRDPIFFRFHSYINYIFEQHKQTLDPYTPDQLSFKGVSISSVHMKTKDVPSWNTFQTFWENTSFNLDLDFTFTNNMEIIADVTRLQHMPFTYHIHVENSGPEIKRGTVRIFLMPSFGDQGERYTIDQQRAIAIEMDRFNIDIASGENTFTRGSHNSSVTKHDAHTNNGQKLSKNYFCCGWPHHLLIPKGNQAGLESNIFVIITDTTKEEIVDLEPVQDPTCESSTFCGILGKKYPTKLAMGFPFDRTIISDNIVYLNDLVHLYSNMAEQKVNIQFSSVPRNLSQLTSVESEQERIPDC